MFSIQQCCLNMKSAICYLSVPVMKITWVISPLKYMGKETGTPNKTMQSTTALKCIKTMTTKNKTCLVHTWWHKCYTKCPKTKSPVWFYVHLETFPTLCTHWNRTAATRCAWERVVYRRRDYTVSFNISLDSLNMQGGFKTKVFFFLCVHKTISQSLFPPADSVPNFWFSKLFFFF